MRRRDLGRETVRPNHILWNGAEEASLSDIEGEENLFLSPGDVLGFCGSWSQPVLEVWWAVSLCCAIWPARSGAEILGPCGKSCRDFLELRVS